MILKVEINLIVNGEITKKFYVDSSFYNLVKHEYRSIVFDAVKLYNKLSNDNLYKYIGEYYVWISLKYNVHTLSAVERIYDSLEGDEFTTDMLNVMLKEHKTSVSNVLLSLLKILMDYLIMKLILLNIISLDSQTQFPWI